MEKETLLVEYNYEVNLHLATEELVQQNFDLSHKTLNGKFQLYVDAQDFADAKRIVDSLCLDDNVATTVDSEVTLEDYEEWGEQQYSPGHYTGGKTPHWYKDKKTMKILGPLMLLSGIAALYYLRNIFSTKNNQTIDYLNVVFLAIYLFAGAVATYNAYKKQ